MYILRAIQFVVHDISGENKNYDLYNSLTVFLPMFFRCGILCLLEMEISWGEELIFTVNLMY